MSAIRPDLPAFGQTPAPVAGNALRDAQAAFFRMALGQTTAPTAQAATQVAPQAPPQATRQTDPRFLVPQITPTVARSAEGLDPERPLRPGSLLDIRI